MNKKNKITVEGTRTDNKDESNAHPISKRKETLPTIPEDHQDLQAISQQVAEIKHKSDLVVHQLAIGSQATQGMDRKRLEQNQTEEFGSDGSYTSTTQFIAEGERDSVAPNDEYNPGSNFEAAGIIAILFLAGMLAMFLLSRMF